MKIKRRYVSVLLCAAVLLSLWTGPVYAEAGAEPQAGGGAADEGGVQEEQPESGRGQDSRMEEGALGSGGDGSENIDNSGSASTADDIDGSDGGGDVKDDGAAAGDNVGADDGHIADHDGMDDTEAEDSADADAENDDRTDDSTDTDASDAAAIDAANGAGSAWDAEGTDTNGENIPDKAGDAAVEKAVPANIPAAVEKTAWRENPDVVKTPGGKDIAIADVQDRIGGLPGLEEVQGMSPDRERDVYERLEEAYDAYEALTEEEQAQIEGVEIFEELFGWFHSRIMQLSEIGSGDFNGADGSTFHWSLEEDGTLTVTGTGEMSDFMYGSNLWKNNKDTIKKVVVGNGITSIGACAFMDCTNLTQIELPPSLTSIGVGAFDRCTSLTQIELPPGLNSIESSAFMDCTSLTQIELPLGLTSIKSTVFYNCTSLTQVGIPSSVNSIWYGAFMNCTSLTQIELPPGLNLIRDEVFRSCANLTDVTFTGSTAPALGTDVFRDCNKLEAIYIPEGAAGYSGGNWPADKAIGVKYSITVQAGTGGTAGASRDFAVPGMKVTLTAAPNSGWRLKEWQTVSGGMTVSGNGFTMPDGNVTVMAVFEAVPETSGGNTGSAGGGNTGPAGSGNTSSEGSGNADPAGGSVPDGNTDPIEEDICDGESGASSGRSVSRGSGKSSGSATYYALVFETNGGNVIKPVSRAYGTTIDLTGYVPVREGYEFDGWYADRGLTRKVTQIRLDGGKAVYAGWKEGGLTRSETALLFYIMEGSPEVKEEAGFPDIEYGPDTAWRYDAVTWAWQNGVLGVYDDGAFHPDDPVTREQLAAAFYRYAKYKGCSVTAVGSLDVFPDKDEASASAQEALIWALTSGMLSGREDGTLAPQEAATRSETAVMLYCFMKDNGFLPEAFAAGDAGISGAAEGTGGTGRTAEQEGGGADFASWLVAFCMDMGKQPA